MAPSLVLFSLLAIAWPHVVAEVSKKPWVLRRFYSDAAIEDVSLACPEGFSFSCKSICCLAGQYGGGCTHQFGANFEMSVMHHCTGHGSSYSTQHQECCECVSSAPPITSLPQTTDLKWVTSQECELAAAGRFTPRSCGLANLTCPQGFSLSAPFVSCRSCPDSYATRVKLNESSYCISSIWDLEGGNGGPSWVCQTCVQETLGTTTTTTTAIRYGHLDPTCADGGFRDWEVVGVEGAGACRGNHGNDNGSYYHVVSAYSIDECKGKCILELPQCKGIEYSFGRCEIWTRPEGIFVTKNLQNFTCLRYGWPTKYLQPMDGGSDRACRRNTPTDNNKRYYWVQKSMSLEDCKARCAAAEWVQCRGIEFSLGRCEIWKQQVGATANIPGFQCFHYSDPRSRRLGGITPSKLPTSAVEAILP